MTSSNFSRRRMIMLSGVSILAVAAGVAVLATRADELLKPKIAERDAREAVIALVSDVMEEGEKSGIKYTLEQRKAIPEETWVEVRGIIDRRYEIVPD